MTSRPRCSTPRNRVRGSEPGGRTDPGTAAPRPRFGDGLVDAVAVGALGRPTVEAGEPRPLDLHGCAPAQDASRRVGAPGRAIGALEGMGDPTPCPRTGREPRVLRRSRPSGTPSWRCSEWVEPGGPDPTAPRGGEPGGCRSRRFALAREACTVRRGASATPPSVPLAWAWAKSKGLAMRVRRCGARACGDPAHAAPPRVRRRCPARRGGA